MTMATYSAAVPATARAAAWRESLAAGAVALALHAAAVALLLTHWQPRAPKPPRIVRAEPVRMVVLPAAAAPAPAAAPVAAPAPQPAPAPPPARPRPPRPQPTPKPQPVKPQLPARQPLPQPIAQPGLPETAVPDAAPAANNDAPTQTAAAGAPPQAASGPAPAAAHAGGNDHFAQTYRPLEKKEPDYPERALSRRLEGDCTVAYTVTPEGRVSDTRIEGDCHPLFRQPSLQAARQFRYRPRIVDGQAVAVPGVRNVFRFRIQEP